MSQKGRTLDEKFLIQVYRTSTDQEVDIREVASFLRFRENAVKNIVRDLAQANFIKKLDGTKIVLTAHGRNFVEQELEG